MGRVAVEQQSPALHAWYGFIVLTVEVLLFPTYFLAYVPKLLLGYIGLAPDHSHLFAFNTDVVKRPIGNEV